MPLAVTDYARGWSSQCRPAFASQRQEETRGEKRLELLASDDVGCNDILLDPLVSKNLEHSQPGPRPQ